jgi:hypothetical protein
MGDEIEMRGGNQNGRFPKPEYERTPDEADSEEYVEPFHVPATAQRPRKLSRQFRGRQIQMMAISPFPVASPVQVANCKVSLSARGYFPTQVGTSTRTAPSHSFLGICGWERSCTP